MGARLMTILRSRQLRDLAAFVAAVAFILIFTLWSAFAADLVTHWRTFR